VNLLLSFVQPFEKLQKPRENFKQQYSEMLSNFRENFKPLYDAITGQFSEDISTAEIITMILDYLQNQLGYRINQFILDEVDGKILKHLNSNNLENKSLYSRLKEQIPRYSRYSESDLLLGNERVVIATIHKSKGLEFETVVVPDVVEDVFPNFYSKEEEKILEDARLLYVAITRAKQKLWLTFSEIKPIETKKGIWNKPQHLSRFLTGINWSKHII
jgi:DNA helicase-2/ATP-dependent DNA helicase PcrA